MGRILFILPALPDFEPYVFGYIKIADECKVDYDVICWNRKGEDVSFPDNYYVYQHPTSDLYTPVRKMIEITGFSSFVRRVLRKNKYSLVFTFTIADSVFLAPLLTRKYRGNYVFDIRDYSPIVDSPFFKPSFRFLLSHSAINVISSEGFKNWLPDKYEYLLCHNTDIDKIKESLKYSKPIANKQDINILTIGALRDVISNTRIVDAFANRKNVLVSFVGDGNATPLLRRYCEEHNVINVSFHGRYHKEDEDGFVEKCDLMNLLMPHNSVSDFLMSNRFYLAARLRKPMIVNDNCFQARQVEKYGLGIVVKESEQLNDVVESYYKSIDWQALDDNCIRFLNDVYDEQTHFRKIIKRIITERN